MENPAFMLFVSLYQESILPRFNLRVINKYFPEFEEVIITYRSA